MAEKTLKTPYYIWKIGDRELKLKLTTKNIFDLENEYGKNLMYLLNDIPTLETMLTIITKATEKFNHGITKEDVFEMYDDFVDEGHTQAELFATVVMGVFGASGFFSLKMKEQMADKLEEAKELL